MSDGAEPSCDHLTSKQCRALNYDMEGSLESQYMFIEPIDKLSNENSHSTSFASPVIDRVLRLVLLAKSDPAVSGTLSEQSTINLYCH